MFFNKTNTDSKQRFGIRKLSIGACSVLLSTLFLGISIEQQTPKVHAATDGSVVLDKNSTNEVEQEPGEAKSEVDTSQKSTPSTDKATAASQETVVTEQTFKTNKVVDKTVRASKTAVQTEVEQNTATDMQVQTETANGETHQKQNAQDTTQLEKRDATASSAKLENNAKDGSIDAKNKDMLAVTTASLGTGKGIDEKALRQSLVGETAPQSSEVNKIKNNASIVIPSTNKRYTLYVSQTSKNDPIAWGNTSNGKDQIKILLNGNVYAGDVVTISIPKIMGVQLPTLDPQYGTVSATPDGNFNVVTYTFNTVATMSPVITIPIGNAYTKQDDKPITFPAYPTTQNISWTTKEADGKEVTEKPAEFNLSINPNWNPTPLNRIQPDPKAEGDNTLKKMIPNYKAIYQIKINENDGIEPGEDYTTSIKYTASHINSAVNHGTTITIPMPKGFILDETATMDLNKFGDQTTVKQNGNDVIITVPRGSGTQSWEDKSQGYRIVGSYDIAMPDKATTISADAPITITQKLDDQENGRTKTYTGETVSEDFYGKDEPLPLGIVPLYASGAYKSKNWLLSNGKKQIVSYFGLTNESIGDFTNYSGTVTLDFDKQLNVTEIKTPTISGTKNYKYVITYADGTTTTGEVAPGKTVTGTSAIESVSFALDNFNFDSGSDTVLPDNSFVTQTQKQANAFEAYGFVAPTVKEGTKLNSNITFKGKILGNTLTNHLSTPISQTVISPDNLTSEVTLFGWQTEKGLGKQAAGYMSISTTGGAQTGNIYEPIFYYVLPEWTTVNNYTGDLATMRDPRLNTNNGVIADPKLSLFTVPGTNNSPSRQVVKIDYTGTGYNFNATQGANNLIWLNTTPDAENGKYHGLIYIVSPKTKLNTGQNHKYNSSDISNMVPAGTTFNPAWVENDTNNLYFVGNTDFEVNQVGGASTVSLAQGNKNDLYVEKATTDLYGKPEMHFAVRLINNSGEDLDNVAALINLPQASTSGFTFQLNGRPTYGGDKSDYTFLYSTELGKLGNNTDSDGTKPDENGYVEADQVTDWSKIKSIIVKTNSLTGNQRSSRLIFTGTDPNLVNDAGKTAYISTGFYSDQTKPFITEVNSLAPGQTAPGHITISGTAKINYSLHYTDADGQEHTVAIPDLTTYYDLSKSNTMLTEQEAINNALNSDGLKSLLPAGYELVKSSAKLITSKPTWQNGADNGTAEFGKPVQYFYNNAIVQLEAVPIAKTLTYQVIDENNSENPVTVTPTTNLLVNGKEITGNQGDPISSEVSTAYEGIKKELEDKGYVISDKSSTVPDKFGIDNSLTIYVTHGTTKVNDSKKWPDSVVNTDRVDLSKTVTRTITVTGLPEGSNVSGTTQKVECTRTAIVDNVTHKVIGYVDPDNSDKTITDGDTAWTSTKDSWDAFTPQNVPAGYSVKSITSNGTDYPNVTKDAEENLTGVAPTSAKVNDSDINVIISYKANEVSNTIKFIDTDNDNAQIGNKIEIKGTVGQTIPLNLHVPDGYELVADETLPINYTFEATNSPLEIKLKHKIINVGPEDQWPENIDQTKLSKSITRTIKVSGLPNSVQPIEQNVTFTRTAIVDLATKKVIGYVDPADSSKTVSPENASQAWTSSNNKWAAWNGVENIPEGYYISGITSGEGNYADVTKNDKGIITEIKEVSVKSDSDSLSVNVEYSKVDINLTINHNEVTNTYNGKPQPVGSDLINEIAHIAVPSNEDISVAIITDAIKNANLTAEDYFYTDAQGNVLKEAPTNVGQYRIILNKNGLDKLKKLSGGLTINYDPTQSFVKYSIDAAQAIAKLGGSNNKDFDNQSVTIDQVKSNGKIKVSLSYLGKDTAYNLQNGDYTWSTKDGSAPTNVSSYTISLTKAGFDHLKALLTKDYGDNIVLTTTLENAGTASFTITPITTTATISGSNSKIYDEKVISTKDLYAQGGNISINIKGIGDNTKIPYTLQDGDYVWKNVTDPTNVDKYTFTLTQAGLDHLQDILNKQYQSGNVTISAKDITGNGTFEIKKATATVKFNNPASQTVKYTGKISQFDAKNYPLSISANNGLTLNIPDGVNLSVADGDFIFTDTNKNTQTAEPTELGTYTVTLSESGFKKLQSQTNNYTWDNQTSGTYSITKADNISVVLSNVNDGQSETYIGKQFANKDINVIDYQVTLGNGEKYQLVAGDLEFAPNQDPTNVGSYKVQLSAQGKANIAKVQSDKYSYNFGNTGNGAFEITKAIPTANFTAEGTKTYDGNPIANYKPTLTIDAPGANVPELTAGVDYVWTKDGQTFTTAPSDAGNYTVTLTEKGINKVKAVNADNLDWNKVTITQDATYVIDKAKATVNFAQPASQTVSYGKGDFAEANFAPAISTDNQVTVNVPKGVKLSIEDGDYVFTEDGQSQTAEPTELGTYTVTLSESGFKKLQSQTNNYEWINAAQGTYVVEQARGITVILANINNGQSEIHTGNAFTNKDIKVANYQVTLDNGQIYKLVDGDLEFVPDQDPTDVGVYMVRLSDQGKSHIEALDSKHYTYDFSNAGFGSFEIKKAIPNVNFTANASKTYDGSPIDLKDYATQPTLTIIAPGNPTIALTDGDYVWVKDGVTYRIAPSDVGTYTIQLTDQGKNKILQSTANAKNLNWSEAKISGEGSYVITAATAKANLEGNASRTYNGQPVTTAEVNGKGSTIKVTIDLNDTDKITYTLQDNDYTWNTPNRDAPINSDDYKISLSDQVLTKLQDAADAKWGKGNVKITKDDLAGNADFTINKANMPVIMQGSDSKVSDGKPPANVSLETLIKSLSGTNLNTNGLILADFSWNTSDGAAPSKVGNYTVALNENGVKKLNSNNPNYEVKVTGNYKFEITAAGQTVEYVDGDGKVIKTVSVTPDGANYGDKVNFDIAGNIPINYELTDSTNVPTQITIENGKIQFRITSKIQTTTDSKSVIRTITVKNPDGTEFTVKQTVTFTRPMYTNLVTNTSTYGDWDKQSGTWAKYNAPEIEGYTSNEIAEKKVTPETKDTATVVTYTKNQEPNNPVTPPDNPHETPDEPKDKPDNPSKPNVTPDQPKDEPKDKPNKRKDKKKAKTENNKPKYESRNISANKSAESKHILPKGLNQAENSGVKSLDKKGQHATKENGRTLPQTGSHKDNWAIISGILAMGLGIFGLGDRRKKKD